MKATQSAKRLSGDDGAALIEGALVAGPFFLLVFGILEFGLLFQDHLTVKGVSSSAVREASIRGSETSADFHILDAIKKGTVGLNPTSIGPIVVWHAEFPTSTIPAGCKSGVPSYGDSDTFGACNVYDYTDFNAWAEADFDCDSLTAGPDDHYWCGEARKDYVAESSIGAGDEGTSYIGIYVQADHYYVTGLFGDSVNVSNNTIIPIEARGLNS